MHTPTQNICILERPRSAGIFPCHYVSMAWLETGSVVERFGPFPFPHQEETMPMIWGEMISCPAAALPQTALSRLWGMWLSHGSAAMPRHRPKLPEAMRSDTTGGCCCSQHGQKPTERIGGAGSPSHQGRPEPLAPAVWRLYEDEAWHVGLSRPSGSPVTPARCHWWSPALRDRLSATPHHPSTLLSPAWGCAHLSTPVWLFPLLFTPPLVAFAK